VLDHRPFDVEVKLDDDQLAELLEKEKAEDQAAEASVAGADKTGADAISSAAPADGLPSVNIGLENTPSPPEEADSMELSGKINAPNTPLDGSSMEEGTGEGDGAPTWRGHPRTKEEQTWRPMTRCKKVLEKIEENPWSDIFKHPVDTSMFKDYLDIVETPMDLSAIRQKLEEWSYRRNGPEEFAREVRLVRTLASHPLSQLSVSYCVLLISSLSGLA
jgi:hypothetical protein